MTEITNEIPLGPEEAVRIADSIVAFALEFYEEGSGNPEELEWITNMILVRRFVVASGLRSAQKKSPTAGVLHKAYVKTADGKKYFLNLYKVKCGESGLIVLANGSSQTTADLHATILEAYDMSSYEPKTESQRMKTRTPL